VVVIVVVVDCAKMADKQVERVSLSTKLASNPGNIVVNTCQCCDILKSELHKANLASKTNSLQKQPIEKDQHNTT
jgi:hypothetical protein